MGLAAKRTQNLSSGSVVVGDDGFLFHLFGNAINQLCTDDPSNDHAVARWQLGIERNFAWCAEQKTSYVAFIVPERHVVYADKLPPPYRITATRPLARLLNSIDPSTRSAVLYPLRELLTARETGAVFYKTDEHLNNHGYYTCYLALLAHIQADYPAVPVPRPAMKFESVHVSGNLGMLIDEEPTEDREYWLPAHDRGVKIAFLSGTGTGRVEIFQSQDLTLPRAIIFGDSHLDELRHILAPHFSRVVVVHHSHKLFRALVLSEQPDFVFQIMAELNLGQPYDLASVELPVDDILARCGEHLPRGPILLSIDFRRGDHSRAFTTEGWALPEPTHTWMLGTESILRLPLETTQTLASSSLPHTMTMSLWPLTWAAPSRDKQRLRISYGEPNAWTIFADLEVTTEADVEFALPRFQVSAEKTVSLRFEHPDAFALSDYGQSDGRILSIAVKRITISTDRQKIPTTDQTRSPPTRVRFPGWNKCLATLKRLWPRGSNLRRPVTES